MATAHSTVRYRKSNRYPGYRVGDDGSVWSRQWGYWRQLSPYRMKKRGKVVLLTVEFKAFGKRVRFTLGGLVLTAFVGPCPDGMEACHNDGDPLNNHVDNLRWDTHANNCKDTIKHGRTTHGQRQHMVKLKDEEVLFIKRALKTGEMSQADMARKFKVSPQTICDIHKGRRWVWIGQPEEK